MTGKSKKNLKIVGATFVSLFSLITVFSATMAWFVFVRKVDGSDMTVKVTKLSGRLDYVEFHDIYKIDTETDSKIYQFQKTPFSTIDYNWSNNTAISSNSDVFVMSNYSPLVQEHPLLVVFAFDMEYTSLEDGDIYIKGITSITDFLGKVENGAPKYPLGPDSGSPAYIKTKNGHDYYASSSIINFRSKAFTTSEYNALVAVENTTIDIPDSSVITYENFVSINPENPDDVSFNQEPTLYSADQGDSMRYIVVLVNYYPEAISIIYSTYLGNSYLENTYGGSLYFACDWSLEVF